jgi:hypothetical protein
MLLTPVLWRLEPVLHVELAGHSGPADWVFYVVWAVTLPAIFSLFLFLHLPTVVPKLNDSALFDSADSGQNH